MRLPMIPRRQAGGREGLQQTDGSIIHESELTDETDKAVNSLGDNLITTFERE